MASSLRAIGHRLAMEKTLRLSNSIEEVHQNVLRTVAMEIVAEAVKIVPVKTGFLQSTIDIHGEGPKFVNVGALAHYAGFVEFGTSKMVAHPYLRPALLSKQQRYPDLVFRQVQDLL